MINKKNLIKLLDTFPETFTLDELIDRIVLIEKIEIGLNQSEDNDVISEEDINAEIKTWERILLSEKDFEDGNTVTNDELNRMYTF